MYKNGSEVLEKSLKMNVLVLIQFTFFIHFGRMILVLNDSLPILVRVCIWAKEQTRGSWSAYGLSMHIKPPCRGSFIKNDILIQGKV